MKGVFRSNALKSTFFLIIAALLLFPQSSLCGGGNAYPNGAEGFMVGAAPPPGLTLINYLYFYDADEKRDGDGEEIAAFDHIKLWAEVLRLIWISKTKILGANYGQHAFFLLTNVNLDFNQPFGTKQKRHYRSTDLPYLIWSPCLLTWHLMEGRFHVVLDLADLYIPLYNEKDDNLSAMGRNFWTIEPVLAMTYMPTRAWEFSVKLMYDFNTRQEDYVPGPPIRIDRTPGQEFHMDFNTSYGITSNLRIGLGGYYYRQVTNDKFHHIERYPAALQSVLKDVEDDQSTVWAIGPGIWYKRGPVMATLRTQWEFLARNKTEGCNAWFKLIYLF